MMKKCQLLVLCLMAALASCKDGKQAAVSAVSDDLTDGTLASSEEEQGGLFMAKDIEQCWRDRTIHVKGEKSDVVTVFQAFNDEFPTKEGNSIVKATNPCAVHGEAYQGQVIIDLVNNYVESPYVGEGSAVSAALWNRKDGHKLLGVRMGMHNDDVKEFVCFYDFDPATRVLTPEEGPWKKENMLFPDKRPVSYVLPREGKNFIVKEGGAMLIYEGMYNYDGQNLQFVGFDTGWNAKMEEECHKEEVHETMTKFALIDIDEDGKEELWVRSEDDEGGGIFYVEEGNPYLLVTETHRMRPSFAKGKVSVGGPAGGPSYYTCVAVVKNSKREHIFTDFQVEDSHEYVLDGKNMSAAEGKKFRESLKDDYQQLTPKWYPMVDKYKVK
ncbi:MAG: hypothetical protein IJP82_10980 [Bacteroidaceae bacterium]|nr:hypothetical protein [Bacteroidaceae bacterium]